MLGASHLSLVAANPDLYDPYWSSVVLLLGFENTIADASLANVSLSTNTGVVVFQTSPAKFNTYSGYLGTGTALDVSSANTSSFYFGTGDFTIETWVYAPTATTPDGWGSNNVCIMDIANKLNGVQGGPSGFFLSTSSRTTVSSYVTAVYDNTAMGFVGSNVVLPTNAWNHIATGRQGTTFYLATNGIMKTAGTSSKNWFPYNVNIKNDAYLERNYAANFDEFRVTKGVWRYGTGTTYTVPTERFPRQ
jgi:hypothetical protein